MSAGFVVASFATIGLLACGYYAVRDRAEPTEHAKRDAEEKAARLTYRFRGGRMEVMEGKRMIAAGVVKPVVRRPNGTRVYGASEPEIADRLLAAIQKDETPDP